MQPSSTDTSGRGVVETAPLRDIRWAMVGTGDVSHSIAPDFSIARGANLVAVCSRSSERGAAFGEQHGIARVHDDFDRLLGDRDVDAVYIATPHGTHRELAIRALRAGKHILVEKPMALDTAEVEEVLQTARLGGLFAMEAMWMRFNPPILELSRMIRDGVIGEVRSVRASFGFPFPRDRGSRWSAELGGSTLLDQGSYAINLATMFLGRSTSIHASAVVEKGVDVAVRATLEYPEDRFAQIAVSVFEYLDPSASINGTTGWITIDPPFWASAGFEVRTVASTGLGSTRYEFDRRGHGFVPMIEAASETIRGGCLETVEYPEEDAIDVFRELGSVRTAMA